jgi:hypothetical protein
MDQSHSNNDDFLKSKLSLGVIFNGTYEDLQQFKKDIAEAAEKRHILVVYQKLSTNKLFVTENKEGKNGE